MNTTLDFGSTDVGPIVLGIKNSGADGAVPAAGDADTNFAIVQGLAAERREDEGQRPRHRLQPGPARLSPSPRPSAQRRDVHQTYKPVELGGKAAKQFQSDLKKVGHHRRARLRRLHRLHHLRPGDHRASSGGQEPDPPELRRRHPQASAQYDGAGLTCQPIDRELRELRQVTPHELHLLRHRQERQVRGAQQGQAGHGKLVGDPTLIAQYRANGRHRRPRRPRHHHDRRHPTSRKRRGEPVRRLPSCPCRELSSPGGPFGTSRNGMFLSAVLLAGHAEDPLADVVAGHLGGAAADARRLAFEEVEALLRPRVVGQRGRRAGPGELQRDGVAALVRRPR